MIIKPSDWEPTPLLLLWRGRMRRRVSVPVTLFNIVTVSHKRVWEYGP